VECIEAHPPGLGHLRECIQGCIPAH
jgi:hypothetical protein